MCVTRNTNNLDSCRKVNKSVYIIQRSSLVPKNEPFKMITTKRNIMSFTNVKFRMQNSWEVLLSTGVSNKLPSKCPLDVMKITCEFQDEKRIEMQKMYLFTGLILTSKVLWNILSQPSFLQILLVDWEMMNYWNMCKHTWKWRIWGKNRDCTILRVSIWYDHLGSLWCWKMKLLPVWGDITLWIKIVLFCVHNFINVDKISNSTD